MKRLLLLIIFSLSAVAAGAADFDTIRCAYQEGSSRPTCTVLAINSTGLVAVVRETNPLNGESTLYLVSRKSNRDYGGVGPAAYCATPSESGPSCHGAGDLVSLQFKVVNGIEILDTVTTESKSRQDLCSNYLPLDFNEGPLVDGVKYIRQAPNESSVTSGGVFRGDPALQSQEDIPRTAIYPIGDSIRVYAETLVAAGSELHYRWVLTNRFYAPGLTSVRFGTATYTRGSVTFSGAVTAGVTQVLEVRSAIGVRVYRVQDPIVLRAAGLDEEVALLPNGSVRPYLESKCPEYY